MGWLLEHEGPLLLCDVVAKDGIKKAEAVETAIDNKVLVIDYSRLVRCKIARQRSYLAYLTVGVSLLEVNCEDPIVERDLLHGLSSVHATAANYEQFVPLVHMGSVHFNSWKLHLVGYSEWKIGELQSLEIEPKAVLAGLVLISTAEQVSILLSRVLAERMRIAGRRRHISLFVGYMSEMRARLVYCVEVIVKLPRLRLDPSKEQRLTFEALDRGH